MHETEQEDIYIYIYIYIYLIQNYMHPTHLTRHKLVMLICCEIWDVWVRIIGWGHFLD